MIENVNPSYETLIKRLQQIWQQSVSNSESIQNSQPDNSKIQLEPTWLQSIGIVDDTRVKGVDQPASLIASIASVPNVITPGALYFPITYNITSGLFPMTVTYTYQNILKNITEEIIPFLEYQTSFSVPTGNLTLAAGYVWNVDTWVDKYVVIANGQNIWNGVEPPFGSAIQISQYQVDKNYATYYKQSWVLSFTSPDGGVYGSGQLKDYILIDIIDTTTNTYVPITDAIIDPVTGVFIPPNMGDTYEFEVWDNGAELGYTLQYTLMNPSTVIIIEQKGLYLTFWSATMTLSSLFYIYEDFISIGNTVLYPASGNNTYPPGIPSVSTNSLSPVIFTINAGGPVKYSDIIGKSFSVYVPAPPSYDPFYIRQSKSTDKAESWQANVTFGAIATTQGVATTVANLLSYNDTYTWGLQSGGPYGWNINFNHENIEGVQYYPPQYDMTARVRVAVRPIVNWKKTDKYQG